MGRDKVEGLPWLMLAAREVVQENTKEFGVAVSIGQFVESFAHVTHNRIIWSNNIPLNVYALDRYGLSSLVVKAALGIRDMFVQWIQSFRQSCSILSPQLKKEPLRFLGLSWGWLGSTVLSVRISQVVVQTTD